MPDAITPVAADIQAPNANQSLSTLTGIINYQQAKQNLATGAYRQQVEQAQAATSQMALGERQRVQKIISSGVDDQGNSILGSDGKPDPDLAMKWMPRVAPTTYPTYLSNIQQTEANKLGLKKSAADLSQTYRDQIGGILTGFLNDPSANSARVQAMLTPYGAQNPDAAPAISHATALLKGLDSVKTRDPKADLAKKNDMLSHVISAFNPNFAPKPGMIDTGGALQPASTSAAGAVTPAGPPIGKSLAPQIVNTPAGPLAQAGGAGAGSSPIPANLNLTNAQRISQQGTAQGITDRVQQAQAAANNTVQSQDALTRARVLLDSPGLDTGAAFDKGRTLSNLMASIGIDTQGATDANSLVKNLARYEAARATQAGLGGTDAARELAHNGSPNTSIDKNALKGIVTQSLATEKAVAAYANAQTKAANDPQRQAQLESQFRSIPNLIQGYEYGLARNPREAEEFLRKHGLSVKDMAATRAAIKQFEVQ